MKLTDCDLTKPFAHPNMIGAFALLMGAIGFTATMSRTLKTPILSKPTASAFMGFGV